MLNYLSEVYCCVLTVLASPSNPGESVMILRKRGTFSWLGMWSLMQVYCELEEAL